MDAGCGEQGDDNEQDDQSDEHDALLVWVDNTKDNHVTVTMNTRFIVFIGAVTEQLAAMGLTWEEAMGLRPGFGNPKWGRSLSKGGEGCQPSK